VAAAIGAVLELNGAHAELRFPRVST